MDESSIKQGKCGKKKYQSLRMDLTLWFLALSLIPLLGVSWFSYEQAKQSLVNAAEDKLTQSSLLTTQVIQNWFNYRLLNLKVEAKSREIPQMLLSLRAGLVASEQPLALYVRSADWIEKRGDYHHHLVTLVSEYDDVNDIYLIDTDGNIIYSVAREADLGENIFSKTLISSHFSASIEHSLNTGKASFSGIERYPLSSIPISSFIALSLLDTAGNIIGVFAIQLQLENFLRSLHSTVDSESSLTHYLVDESGLLLSPIENNWDEVAIKSIDTAQFRAWLNTRENTNLSDVSEQRLLSKLDGFAFEYMGPNGRDVIGLHHVVKLTGVEWLLVSEVDRDEALEEIGWLTNMTLTILILIILAIILSAVFVARKITKPVKKLVQASLDVAKGEKVKPIKISSKNEISQLVDAFNEMLLAKNSYEESLYQANLQAQTALNNLEDQKFALDQHAIVAVTDVKGMITYVNRRFSEISGYQEEELIGKNHRVLNSGRHSRSFFTHMYSVISKGKVWNGEICNRAKDGRFYWVDTTVAPFNNAQGNPESYIAIRTDITKRKLAEIKTKEALSLMHSMLESTNNGVLVTSLDGKVLQYNESYMTLWESEVVSGQDHVDFIFENKHILINPEYFIEKVEQLYCEPERDEFDTLEFVDGRVYERVSLPMKSDDGLLGRVWNFHDISKRMKTQKELILAKEQADLAVKVKSEFLACMSHEIRTPMNGVLGMLGLLNNTNLTDYQKRRVSIALSSAKSLLTLINDILDYSKIDAGKLELENLDFNLRGMLGEFAEGMAFQAQNKQLELILDLKGIEYSTVAGDPSRLRQAMTNLVGNAIKFTTQGEVLIKAELTGRDNGAGWLFKCTISDTGIGIAEEKIPFLFDSFSQVDASTTRKYGGTGLGLSIVQKVCQLMGGEVSLSSEVGKGTCVEFQVNLGLSEQAQLVVPSVNIEKLHLLVVDDNATNREVIMEQLLFWGGSVEGAASAAQAIEMCTARDQHSTLPQFDVAFLDMQMADVDGAELGRRLKSDDRFDAIKLVMMTSMSQIGDAVFFAELGFSAYFPKPTTTSDLFDALAIISEGGEALLSAKPLITHHYLQTLSHHEAMAHQFSSQERILLVEDNYVNQLVAIGVLEDFKISVNVADNGIQAIKMLCDADDVPYSLVLMDCQMPEMDGYEATRQIRAGKAGSENKDIPIIAMTANAMIGDKEKCLEAGMNDYLTKPIDPDKLYFKLNEWLVADNAKDHLDVDDSAKQENEQNLNFTPNIQAASIIGNKMTDKHKLWDRDSLMKRAMGKESLFNSIIHLFNEDMPPRMEALKCALRDEDLSEIRQVSHTIKGVAANVSGELLMEQATNIELAAKEEDISKAQSYLPRLCVAYEELKLAIAEFQQLSGVDHDVKAPMSKEDTKQSLHRLEKLLVEGSYIDLDEFSCLANATKDKSLQAICDHLLSQLADYDYQEALISLNDLNRQLAKTALNGENSDL
ncbi:response regulator [Shewanella sp. VB17]|uniref:response regulator n=1 Tax=Shewanella sp. VB17 TaxID=2739432 RepID=UPI001563E7DD|nr:response regulator [Shewanella sp. VB17]NRD73379.1 response regulator [Shewanella sp. VB17]